MNQQPPLDLCDTLYSFTHLTVLVAPIEYVLGMKMMSAREQDLKDIGMIIKHTKDNFSIRNCLFSFSKYSHTIKNIHRINRWIFIY